MDGNNNNNKPPPHLPFRPPPPLNIQPLRPPVSVPSTAQLETFSVTPLNTQPFRPPPVTSTAPPETFSVSPLSIQPYRPPVPLTSSPSSSNHRRKRSKLTRTDNPTPITTDATASTSRGPSTSTRAPTRRPDPDAPKITRPCTECGRTFWSWKALFGHMRCHPERQWRGINPPAHLRRSPPLALPPPPPLPTRTTSEDDREVATSLLLLGSSSTGAGDRTDNVSIPTRFECSSCKKTFPTHQALGGHRASHKNVKGCFAITRGVEEGSGGIMEGYNSNYTRNTEMDPRLDLGLGMGMGLAHRCGICYKLFPSGQALGGHMRCHGDKNDEPSTSSVGVGLGLGPVTQHGLDLNQPAREEETGRPVCSGSISSSSSSSGSMQLDLRLGI